MRKRTLHFTEQTFFYQVSLQDAVVAVTIIQSTPGLRLLPEVSLLHETAPPDAVAAYKREGEEVLRALDLLSLWPEEEQRLAQICQADTRRAGRAAEEESETSAHAPSKRTRNDSSDKL